MKATTAPLAQRITQGRARIEGVELATDENLPHSVIRNDDERWLALVEITDEEGEANAEFVAEAFTVCHETGRTPRQLAASQAELIAAIRGLMSAIDDKEGADARDTAFDAITRAQGGTTGPLALHGFRVIVPDAEEVNHRQAMVQAFGEHGQG